MLRWACNSRASPICWSLSIPVKRRYENFRRLSLVHKRAAIASRHYAHYAKAFIDANPDRMLWGTDWPHPDSNPYPGRKPSDIMRLVRLVDRRHSA